MPDEIDRGNEALWRTILMGTRRFTRVERRAFSRLPSPPRCAICASPFNGPFAPLLRAFGRAPFAKNPRYCAVCIGGLMKHKGGAAGELTALFADVRGSTPLAARPRAPRVQHVMGRLFNEGVAALILWGAP